MNRRTPLLLLLALSAGLVSTVHAGPREDLLARYSAEARAADPAFKGFSASRGEAFHLAKPGGGKADTPSCTSCHGADPRQPGQTLTGKAIAPMALSLSPDRYTDPAKVEKWFTRNCKEVLGRECSAQEKGDWLAWMQTR